MAGTFLISLDFELFWGMRDKCRISEYGGNILGVREAIPAMLELFRRYHVRVTWAAVGMLLFDSKKDLKAYLPAREPLYRDQKLSPYRSLEEIGETERSDPYHFGLSLARTILSYEGMELGSHTFSHYYCLEWGQDVSTFRADLEASVEATARLTDRPVSLVFPRNQCNPDYLEVCADLGFHSFRGNQPTWMYRAMSESGQQPRVQRAVQLLDAYVNFSGDNGFFPGLEGGLVNLPASRFLRPFHMSRRKYDSWRLARIRNSMTAAARSGKSFHLWWHPHNFGAALNENVAFLVEILKHYASLRDSHGMVSMTMREAAACAVPCRQDLANGMVLPQTLST